MNFYLKRILIILLMIFFLFIPYAGYFVDVMPLRQMFASFRPGERITTPFFVLLIIYFIKNTVLKFLTDREIKRLRETKTDRHFIK